jgi:hypothetical protein
MVIEIDHQGIDSICIKTSLGDTISICDRITVISDEDGRLGVTA